MLLDFNALNEEMNELNLTPDKKLPFIYEKMGGEFHDANKKLLKGSKAAIVGFGGLMLELDDEGNIYVLGAKTSLDEIKNSFHKMLGMSAMMSYLNPKNKSLTTLAKSTLELEHFSVLHTLQINILLCGISSGVEHEYSSQRDIIHLSRLTVAKTKAQSSPSLVVKDENYIYLYENILYLTEKLLSEEKDKTNLELKNLLYPSAKASMIMLSGNVKNFLKLVSMKQDGGKEDEFIDSLIEIEKCLKLLFPELIV